MFLIYVLIMITLVSREEALKLHNVTEHLNVMLEHFQNVATVLSNLLAFDHLLFLSLQFLVVERKKMKSTEILSKKLMRAQSFTKPQEVVI